MNSPVVQKTPWSGFAWVAVAYLLAIAVAGLVFHFVPAEWHVMWQVVAADVAATVVIFAFSRALDNTSMYDAYWSVGPLAIALWLVLVPGRARDFDARQVLVLVLIAAYAIRLTWNWIRGWPGLAHEDWRYVDFRKQMKGAYWFFSFGGLHVAPTFLVLVGLLPLYSALVVGAGPLNGLDVIAAIVTGGAVLIEGIADNQLRAYRADPTHGNGICDVGLWAYSRHPNYFGEISFWVGLFLFGLAAGAPVWTGVGALTMIALFVGATIPMSEKRSLSRRPTYAEHQKRVSMLVPWFPKKGA